MVRPPEVRKGLRHTPPGGKPEVPGGCGCLINSCEYSRGAQARATLSITLKSKSQERKIDKHDSIRGQKVSMEKGQQSTGCFQASLTGRGLLTSHKKQIHRQKQLGEEDGSHRSVSAEVLTPTGPGPRPQGEAEVTVPEAISPADRRPLQPTP